MQLAIIDYKNNTIEKYGEHRKLFPNVSFPKTGPSEEWIKNNSCLKIIDHIELPNVNTKLERVTPYLEVHNNVYYPYSVRVISLTSDETNQRDVEAQDGQRGVRNMLLRDSDWTQMPDSPLSDSKKAEWATYRQKLRDFTTTSGWVDANFPDKPS